MRSDGPASAGYYKKLVPAESGWHLRLDEVWRYRDLVLLLTKKSFTVTYQQTLLGPLWIIINPVLSSLVYMFIFGHIAEIGTDGVPQILFYFLSSSLWGLFSYSLTSNASTFVTNAHLFGKVYFPRLTVPFSNMLVSILKFLVQLGIVAVLMAAYVVRGDIHPNWGMFPLLPLLFIQLSFLGMSTGIFLSSLTTRYRDLMLVVTVGVNLWMYASPVVYPMSSLSEGLMKTLIKLNPVTEVLELVRLIMVGEGEFEMAYYGIGLVITIIMFAGGAAIFNRVERTFADTV